MESNFARLMKHREREKVVAALKAGLEMKDGAKHNENIKGCWMVGTYNPPD